MCARVAVGCGGGDLSVELACAAVRLVVLYADARKELVVLSAAFAKKFNVPLPSVVTDTDQLLTGQTAIVEYVISNSCDIETQGLLLGVTPYERGVVDQWTTFAEDQRLAFANLANLHSFNSNLEERSFVTGTHITIADLMMFPTVHNWIKGASAKEKAANNEILRWFDHIQNMPGIRSAVAELPHISVFPVATRGLPGNTNSTDTTAADVQQTPSAGSGKVTGKAAKKAATGDGKPKGAGGTLTLVKRLEDDPSRLDIRVGVIQKVWNHPEADRLYCEEIDIGEGQVRQIASGLREHLNMDQMQGARVCVLANLKSRNLRKFNSHGMVMCASSQDGSVCELIYPPEGAKIGERITLDGFPYTCEPDNPLPAKEGNNPFVAVQPHWRTDADKIALYKDCRWMTSAGPCVCSNIVGGTIS
eukprot:Lankesteria_metandrocarpae@DN4429_c1_g1_i1.p2